jgi:hypothetical protein
MKGKKIQALVDRTGRVISTALVGTVRLKNGKTATAGIVAGKDQRVLELDAELIAEYQTLKGDVIHRRVTELMQTDAVREVTQDAFGS